MHKVKSTCIWVGKTRPTSLDLGRPKSAPTWSPSHRALPEPASWQGLVQGWTTTAGHLHQQLPHVWPSQGMGRSSGLSVYIHSPVHMLWSVAHGTKKPLHKNHNIFVSPTIMAYSHQQLQHKSPPKKSQQLLASKPIIFLYPQSFFRCLPTKKDKRSREIGRYNTQRGKLVSHQYIHPVKAWISARSLK